LIETSLFCNYFGLPVTLNEVSIESSGDMAEIERISMNNSRFL